MMQAAELQSVAHRAAQGRTSPEVLAIAWHLVEQVSHPEDFRQLDMFLGMTVDHCRDVRLSAAIAADFAAAEQGDPCMVAASERLPMFLLDGLLDRAAATHDKMPDPEPGLRAGIRVALAKAGDWFARSDDTWAGSIIGAVCFAATAVLGFLSIGVLQ